MKLYEFEAFPNPRRVRIFLAEKNIDVERVQVNVPEGEHRGEAFRAKNPWVTVPALELEDGTMLTETTSICAYFEAVQPAPALLGKTPAEKGLVDTWQRRIENSLFNNLLGYFHHATPGLGALELYQNSDWGGHCKKSALASLAGIEKGLEGRDYIAGDFSIADITGLCALDVANWLEIEIPAEFKNVHAWHQRLSARPSAKA